MAKSRRRPAAAVKARSARRERQIDAEYPPLLKPPWEVWRGAALTFPDSAAVIAGYPIRFSSTRGWTSLAGWADSAELSVQELVDECFWYERQGYIGWDTARQEIQENWPPEEEIAKAALMQQRAHR